MVVPMIKCNHFISEAFKRKPHITLQGTSGNLITLGGIMVLLHHSGCFGITQWNRSLILYSGNSRHLHYPLSSHLPGQNQSKENSHSLQDRCLNAPWQFCTKKGSRKNSNSHLNKIADKGIAMGGLKTEKLLKFQNDPWPLGSHILRQHDSFILPRQVNASHLPFAHQPHFFSFLKFHYVFFF